MLFESNLDEIIDLGNNQKEKLGLMYDNAFNLNVYSVIVKEGKTIINTALSRERSICDEEIVLL